MFTVGEITLQVLSKFGSDLRLTPSPLKDQLENFSLVRRTTCLTASEATMKVKNSLGTFLIADRLM